MSEISGNINQKISASGSGQVTFGGAKMSLDEAIALLFLQRSETMSQLATDRAEVAQQKLADIQEARDMSARMTELKQQAGDKKSPTEMPADMVAYCKEHNIDLDTSYEDNWHDKDQWAINIQGMDNYLDKLSSDNDLFMIKLKSVINKSQEALQAADSMVTKLKEVMSSIIANMGR